VPDHDTPSADAKDGRSTTEVSAGDVAPLLIGDYVVMCAIRWAGGGGGSLVSMPCTFGMT
jgi:hypothetical protein